LGPLVTLPTNPKKYHVSYVRKLVLGYTSLQFVPGYLHFAPGDLQLPRIPSFGIPSLCPGRPSIAQETFNLPRIPSFCTGRPSIAPETLNLLRSTPYGLPYGFNFTVLFCIGVACRVVKNPEIIGTVAERSLRRFLSARGFFLYVLSFIPEQTHFNRDSDLLQTQ
jgi:hypothetical protein